MSVYHCWNDIFEFSNSVIEIFIHFPAMKFQNTVLGNFQKIYFKVTFLINFQKKYVKVTFLKIYKNSILIFHNQMYKNSNHRFWKFKDFILTVYMIELEAFFMLKNILTCNHWIWRRTPLGFGFFSANIICKARGISPLVQSRERFLVHFGHGWKNEGIRKRL